MAKQNTKQELKIIKKKDKECVIQGNEISRSFYDCSLTARKIIAFTTSLIKYDDAKLDFDETVKIGIKIPCLEHSFPILQIKM